MTLEEKQSSGFAYAMFCEFAKSRGLSPPNSMATWILWKVRVRRIHILYRAGRITQP